MTKGTMYMVVRRVTMPLALLASVALAVPAAQAATRHPGPSAHSAGSGAAAVDPAVVGVPITRTEKALTFAADFIDQGNGALAAKPLTAARRYLIRSYNGAKYLISLPPPPAPAADGSVRATSAAKFRATARRLVAVSHRGSTARTRWLVAHSSGAAPGAGPAFADGPTAVFDVLMSQYSAATAAIGMYADTTGTLQGKVKLVLDTSIILRNRIVKAVQAAEPPVPAAADGRVKAHSSGAAPAAAGGFGAVMPGLIVVLDDEIQQMKAAMSSLPAAAQADLQNAIAADQKIQTLVNTTWPPAPAG
jgi:hypothetical protein